MARGIFATMLRDALLAKKIKWIFMVIIGILFVLWGFFSGVGNLFLWSFSGYQRIPLFFIGVMIFLIGLDIRKGA